MSSKIKILQPVTAISFAFTLASAAADSGQPATLAAPAPTSPWTPAASLLLKQSYDDNVFLQDLGPNADKGSLITTITPNVGLAYKPSDAFNVSLSYAPEVNIFESQPGENFTAHRVGLIMGGQVNNSSWDLIDNFIGIEGGDLGPTYLQPGGSPAAGGPAVRDRRAALIERGQFRFTQKFGQWFIRPVISGYDHDFLTLHKSTEGYQNFVNRSEVSGGGDLGYFVGKDTALTLGYRYGEWSQAQIFPEINPTYYANDYHRVLFGAEGSPYNWLKMNLSFGPEFSHYTGIVEKGFNRDQSYCFVNASITFIPVKGDTITISDKSFEQPGFSGRSAYLDSNYDLTWRHKLTDKLTVGAGVHAYNTDFIKPSADRNDWIITGSAVASYAFSKQFSAELSYLYDSAESEVADTPGREYTRNCVSLGLKYVFK
jgi:hypothetical protein